MTLLFSLFSNYWQKKQVQAQDKTRAELRPTLTLSTGDKSIQYGITRCQADVVDASWHQLELEVHTEKCTERLDYILDLE